MDIAMAEKASQWTAKLSKVKEVSEIVNDTLNYDIVVSYRVKSAMDGGYNTLPLPELPSTELIPDNFVEEHHLREYLMGRLEKMEKYIEQKISEL